MNEFREVLLEIWRESCRHIDFQESGEYVSQSLSKHVPFDLLLVRRFDPDKHVFDTVVKWQHSTAVLPIESKTELDNKQFRKFSSWAKQTKVSRIASNSQRDLSFVIPLKTSNDILIGPLVGEDSVRGVLILVSKNGLAFQSKHEAMVQQLLEPFLVALENDRRIHQLASLREAAEAERQSLLLRLGSQDMGEAIVGSETGLRMVMERVQLVAGSDAPVLILGETGTGKEVVSRAIHTRSKRSTGPFIRINCGAIPPDLIDSQLFGHEKGSFTGASDSRQGWFERADCGTLFLDEIGELPLPAQVRLLRVLQDGFIERVGGHHPIRVDVRIIAATHRDLATMVKTGGFREDLWYRINVFPILLPRLCERREDIPALARHFARRAAVKFGFAFVEPTPNDLRLLLSYDWPGNIRELGAVIDRAAILGGGKRLETGQALGQEMPQPRVSNNEPTYYEVIPETTSQRSIHSRSQPNEKIVPLDEAIKHHIEKALIAKRGQVEGKGGAAELLQINPHTLRARMRKLGIHWSKFRPT